MKHYRVSIDVDIKAKDEEQGRRLAALIYSDIERSRPWIVEVLPNGMEERIPMKSPPRGSSRRAQP